MSTPPSPRANNCATGDHTERLSGLVLSLGSGGARGMAHIGVLQVLAENAIPGRAAALAQLPELQRLADSA